MSGVDLTANIEKALVLVNPIAGRGDRAEILPDIRRAFGRTKIKAEIVLLPGPDAAEDLIREKAGPGCAVAAAGGDGTAALIAKALLTVGEDNPFGLIPLGFGNCLARSMGVPEDIEASVQVIAEGRCRAIDLGLVGERPVLAFLSAGWDAEVIKGLHEIRQGASRYRDYLKAGWETLQDYAWPRFTVRVDGQDVEGEFFHVIFSQWPIYAKFMTLGHPEGLKVYLFRDPPAKGLLRYQFRLGPDRNLARAADVSVKVEKRLQITASSLSHYQIDGDFGGPLPLDLTVKSKGLKVLCPPADRKAGARGLIWS